MTTGAFGIHDKVVVMYVRLACMYGYAMIAQSMYGLREADRYLSVCEQLLILMSKNTYKYTINIV